MDCSMIHEVIFFSPNDISYYITPPPAKSNKVESDATMGHRKPAELFDGGNPGLRYLEFTVTHSSSQSYYITHQTHIPGQ